ncbi:MAG: hypothetical protein IPM92_09160 [Saprospiraceae bacterium]|nr:hypothetical protein [Saprospiraceae bacterium]
MKFKLHFAADYNMYRKYGGDYAANRESSGYCALQMCKRYLMMNFENEYGRTQQVFLFMKIKQWIPLIN